MVLRCFVVLIFAADLVLLSNIQTAYAAGALLNTQPTPSIAYPSSDYQLVNDSLIQIPNLPVLHSQDGLPTCTANVAVNLYLQTACRENPEVDCANLKPNQIPSALSLLAVTMEPHSGPYKKNNPLPIDKMFKLKSILKRAEDAGNVFANSCFSMDQFVARFTKGNRFEKVKAQREVFLKLRRAYDKAKLESSPCIECLDKEMQQDFGIGSDIQKITFALQQDSFEKFLHRVLLGSCQDAFHIRSINYRMWPEKTTNEPAKYDEVLGKFKQLLTDKMSFGVEFCPYDLPKGDIDECPGGGHEVLVTGYKKVCNARGDCRDLLQVQNSWGPEWQAANNDGWIDAKTLVQYADIGRSSQILYILNLSD